MSRVVQRGRRIIGLNRDFCLDIDIHGMKILTRETGRLALYLSLIERRLHFHILQIWRVRASLGHVHGVRIISIDILMRPRSITRAFQF